MNKVFLSYVYVNDSTMKQDHMISLAIGIVALLSIIISSYVLMHKKEGFEDDIAPATGQETVEPTYCPKGIDIANKISPEFMEYCKDACASNQTLMQPLCECNCARGKPYVMSFEL